MNAAVLVVSLLVSNGETQTVAKVNHVIRIGSQCKKSGKHLLVVYNVAVDDVVQDVEELSSLGVIVTVRQVVVMKGWWTGPGVIPPVGRFVDAQATVVVSPSSRVSALDTAASTKSTSMNVLIKPRDREAMISL